MVTKTCILLCISLCLVSTIVSSLSLDAPNQIQVNSEFIVSISHTDTSKTFDVKIFIHNSTDDTIARSEIYSSIFSEDTWKDAYLYVLSAYPSSSSFKINLDSYSPELNICAQLRESGKNVIAAKTCTAITAIPPSIVTTTPQSNTQSNENTPIILHRDDKTEYISSQEKQRRIISYSFTLVALIIIVLMFLRKV